MFPVPLNTMSHQAVLHYSSLQGKNGLPRENLAKVTLGKDGFQLISQGERPTLNFIFHLLIYKLARNMVKY